MSIRTILTPFSKDSDTPAVRLALAVAKDLQAHVAGIHAESPEPYVPVPPRAPVMAELGAGSFGMSSLRSEIAAAPHPAMAFASRREQDASTVAAHFEQLCAELQVPLIAADAAERFGDHPLPSASYRRESGTLEHVVNQYAHRYDMVVTESAAVAKEGKAVRTALETALLRAGRPVMLAPAAPPEHLGTRIMVAWNDSPQCWHALSTALPFMARAEQVVLFNAGKGRNERLAGERAAEYLAWHGIQAEVAQHEPVSSDIADYLRSQCGERRIGLMVMGAYSHSPWREKLWRYYT